jgi:hypothetical protein
MNQGDNIFTEVTNNDILLEIRRLREDITDVKEHVIQTNGKVKLNRWIATTALTLTLTIVFFLMKAGTM